MATSTASVDYRTIYNETWREELRSFYEVSQKGEDGSSFWAYNFPKAWSKFQRGVAQESQLADLAGRWVNFDGARVLVIGSYLGSEAIAYALRGARVVGIDLDERAMGLARKLAHDYGVDIDFRSVDASRTPFADASFDYISCAQVLEHLPPQHQPRLLAEIWRLTKPGGVFWLDTPNQLAWKDHHDTGLPFIHWLPRPVKVPLAKALKRTVGTREPAFGNEPVHLHYYLGYFRLLRILRGLGHFQVLSRYRGYADIAHYCAERRRQGRARGKLFGAKSGLLQTISHVWNWNWFSGIRLMIRKSDV